MPLKRGAAGGVTFSPDKRRDSAKELPPPLCIRKEAAGSAVQAPVNSVVPEILRQMTLPPRQKGPSTEALALLFRQAGQIGHLAGPEGPIEMVAIAQRGGYPLGELVRDTVKSHLRIPTTGFNYIAAHQQILSSTSGRITTILLEVPDAAQQAGLKFVPVDPTRTPHGPAFLAENDRRALRNMAVSALEGGIPAVTVQLTDKSLQTPVPHVRTTAPRPLLPHEKAAIEAATKAVAPPTAPPNLVQRLLRTGRGQVGPGSNPA